MANLREPAHDLPDRELVGDDDAAVGAPLAGVHLCLACEVGHVERDEGPATGDGEVELLTVGCLAVPRLVRADGVEAAPSEDPSDDRTDVRVEVDREGQSAAVPGEAAPRFATYLELTDSPLDGCLTVLPDGPVDRPAVIVIEGRGRTP